MGQKTMAHNRGQRQIQARRVRRGLVILAGGYVVHKLPHTPDWLPYAVVFVLSVICFVWLGGRARDAEGAVKQPAQASLRERLFSLSKNIKDFVKGFGEETEWVFTAVDKNEGHAKFVSDNKVRLERSLKIKHGFYFRFYSEVLSIFHECGAQGVTDDELFNALGGKLEEDWEFRKIADKLAQMAVQIDE
jgi:hypothetical protein